MEEVEVKVKGFWGVGELACLAGWEGVCGGVFGQSCAWGGMRGEE